MATELPNSVRRRVVLRRRNGGGGGGGFSSGISTRSESYRSAAEDDEVDDAVDPMQLSSRIRTGMTARPPQGDNPEREDPRARLNAVAMAGSATYAKEYRLQLLNRLLMRNIPLDQIAQQLQVSISTVEKDRAELKKRLREAAKELNIDEMVGRQSSVYDEIAGLSLRIASGGDPTPMKLAAMRTALAANADRTRFLASAGVFDVLKFRRAEDGNNLSDVQLLMQRTAEMLASLDDPAPPTSAQAPSGGFAPMTFDDADASRSTQEIESL